MDGEQDPFPDDPTGLLESLRRLDNYAAEISDNQEELATLISQQVDGTERLLEAVSGESGVDLAPDPSTFLFNMSAQVPTSTSQNNPLTETREIDYDGLITEVRAVSTTAAQQTVGVSFGFPTGQRILPRDDPSDARYVPLGQEPIVSEPNVEVSEGDEVGFNFANNDPNQSHFVTALIQVEERL